MHHYLIVGLLQVVCLTLGAVVIQNPHEAGLERSASEGLNSGHLNTKQQFQNLKETGLERSASEALNTRQFHLNTLEQFLNNLESRMGTVEGKTSSLEGKTSSLEGKTSTLQGEMSTVKGKMSSLQGEMSTVKGKVATLGQSRCQTGEIDAQDNFWRDWNYNTLSPSFSPAFHQTPKVIVAQKEYDMSKRGTYYNRAENPQWKYAITNINKNAFTIKFSLFAATEGAWSFYIQGFRWMACA